MLDGANLEAFEIPLSLWRLVEENVSTEQQNEIKNILGESEVDQTLELHAEIEALLQIWQEYRSESEAVNEPIRSSLPEPPMIREGLKNHILLLVESIRERSKDGCRDSNCNLSVLNSDVLQYVLEDDNRETPDIELRRPQTACSSRDGRETPMRMTPSSDGDYLSASSNVSDQVDAVKDHLNVFKIDQVVQELRSSLADETARLLNDIRFLQSCLEEEKDFRCQSSIPFTREPTLSELQEEKNRLQQNVEISRSNTAMLKTDPKNLPSSPKKKLKPLKPAGRPSPPSLACNSDRISSSSLLRNPAKQDVTKQASAESRITGPSPPGSANKRHLTNHCNTPSIPSSARPSQPPSLTRPSPPSSARPSPPSSARPSPPSSAKPLVRRTLSSQRLRHQVKTSTET
ncbi:coiled-coil domain-containing protein 24-like [Antedon mediterranea]|uniref:coiled-coil domain-containing protein 24-like n=1 Tax=Antedon mediterranea TaxID=105859 RepID=UPI003AF52D26